METWDAIRARRNVRDYEDRPIPDDHLDQVLEAGRRTPSSRNEQPWDFVVVTDRDQLQRLSGVWQNAGHVARAAAAIGLVARPSPQDGEVSSADHYDLGQATMSIMLAATDLGVGTAHAWVKHQDVAREVLGLPEDRVLAWLIALGYPKDRPLEPIDDPKRRAFGDVVHRGTWQG